MGKAMRLAFISEYDEIGGGESNLMNLCVELAKDHDVVLFCHGKLYAYASARGIACRPFALSGKRWVRFLPLVSFPRQLRRALRDFDIIHAYSVNVLPRLFFLGKPVVWTTHGYWERPNGMRARVIDFIVRRVVAVSTDVHDMARFSISKKRKIFLGTPLPPSDPAARAYHRDDVHLACIGRFQDIKGQDVLIEALGICAAQSPAQRFTLVFIGDVNGNAPPDMRYRDRLHALAEQCRAPNLTIDFRGFQSDPTPFMRAADFIVIPSRYESFSMVAIEALACGKPVIVPDIGGPKDIVDTPAIGLRFTPGDAASLSRAILAMANDLARYDPEACVRRAHYFSVARQASEHVAMYEELLDA